MASEFAVKKIPRLSTRLEEACCIPGRPSAALIATPPTSPENRGQAAQGLPEFPSRAPITPPDTPSDFASSPPVSIKLTATNIGSSDIFDPYCSLELEGIIGEGQWSKVYRARPRWSDESKPARIPETYALKIARDKFSQKIIWDERRILSLLHSKMRACDFVINFHGWHQELQAIVMDDMPLTLDMLLKSGVSQRSSSAEFPAIPCLANDLVAGLVFLQEVGVIHGDIKPQNILLRPLQEQSSPSDSMDKTRYWHPYYADFSASLQLKPGEDSATPTTAAGGSYDFMAPELFSLKEPDNSPSFHSDVFALGVTLLCVVIGHNPYDGIPSGIMRRAMCSSGQVLDVVQSRFGTVKSDISWLVGALTKAKGDRWDASAWQAVLRA